MWPGEHALDAGDCAAVTRLVFAIALIVARLGTRRHRNRGAARDDRPVLRMPLERIEVPEPWRTTRDFVHGTIGAALRRQSAKTFNYVLGERGTRKHVNRHEDDDPSKHCVERATH
jgi:hypothetical protein